MNASEALHLLAAILTIAAILLQHYK